jgi:hypothetical protein
MPVRNRNLLKNNYSQTKTRIPCATTVVYTLDTSGSDGRLAASHCPRRVPIADTCSTCLVAFHKALGGLHTERLRGSGFSGKPSFLRNRSESLSTLGFEKSSFATSRIFRSLFSWSKPLSEKPSDRRLFHRLYSEFRTQHPIRSLQSDTDDVCGTNRFVLSSSVHGLS